MGLKNFIKNLLCISDADPWGDVARSLKPKVDVVNKKGKTITMTKPKFDENKEYDWDKMNLPPLLDKSEYTSAGYFSAKDYYSDYMENHLEVVDLSSDTSRS